MSNLSAFHQTLAPNETATTFFPLNMFDFTNSSGPYRASSAGIFQYRPTNATPEFEYLLGTYESNAFQFSDTTASIRSFNPSNM
jgi:hypothetical protein